MSFGFRALSLRGRGACFRRLQRHGRFAGMELDALFLSNIFLLFLYSLPSGAIWRGVQLIGIVGRAGGAYMSLGPHRV